VVDREPALLGVEPGAPEASAHEAETARVDARIDDALAAGDRDDVELTAAPIASAPIDSAPVDAAPVRVATADAAPVRAATADSARVRAATGAPAVRAPADADSAPVHAATAAPVRAATADAAPVRAATRADARRADEPAVRTTTTAEDRAPRGTKAAPARPAARGDASTVYVVGFWRRLAAAAIDFAIVLPLTALFTWICSNVAGVHLPPSRMHGPDFWVDLLIGSDPALMMGLGLFVAIGALYLYLFQVTLGRTFGMRVLRLRIIDVWGEPPSHARCAARTAAYFASACTLLLGFVWIGFDSEKRGLHDWIAGTYVIKG
jgi:uncharacterized RDD family membrane protein YckC